MSGHLPSSNQLAIIYPGLLLESSDFLPDLDGLPRSAHATFLSYGLGIGGFKRVLGNSNTKPGVRPTKSQSL